jgi:hypothetical protein
MNFVDLLQCVLHNLLLFRELGRVSALATPMLLLMLSQ